MNIPHKHTALIKAWADGAAIQFFDAARDAYMASCGYRVLRYTDERVHGNPDSVAADILGELQALGEDHGL